MDLGRTKRRLRLLWWQVTGGKKAPEIDAGDIAKVHPDSLLARQAFEERMGRERAAALVSTLPPGASPELSEGGEIVFLNEPEEVDVTDVKSLRDAPGGTVVVVHGDPWTKFGTRWLPGRWESASPDMPSGPAVLSSARLVLLATTEPSAAEEPWPADSVLAEADPVHADPLMERLAAVSDLGVVPESRPDDAPWVGPDGTRSSTEG